MITHDRGKLTTLAYYKYLYVFCNLSKHRVDQFFSWIPEITDATMICKQLSIFRELNPFGLHANCMQMIKK